MSDDKKQGGAKLVTVRVMRDYWVGKPGEAERIRKGTVVDVPIETALDGIESGVLERVK